MKLCKGMGSETDRNTVDISLSRQLEETEKVTRKEDKRPIYLRNSGDRPFYQMVHEPPICMKQAYNLWAEAEITNSSGDRELAAIVLGTGLFTVLGAWIARLN
jgi:hypothetical protein